MSRPYDIKETIKLHHVPALGWMPTIENEEGKEVYRGEYRATASEALDYAEVALGKINPPKFDPIFQGIIDGMLEAQRQMGRIAK